MLDMESSYDYRNMSTEKLADLRAWQLKRLEDVSNALRAQVVAEYKPGDNIIHLAKKAGVTRATIYSWIK